MYKRAPNTSFGVLFDVYALRRQSRRSDGSALVALQTLQGTKAGGGYQVGMANTDLPKDHGNVPSPMLLIGIGVVPILAVIGWFLIAEMALP